jgi:hypothetical protein
MLDTGCWILDAGYWIYESGLYLHPVSSIQYRFGALTHPKTSESLTKKGDSCTIEVNHGLYRDTGHIS